MAGRGAPNAAQSATLKAVARMLEAERAGARHPKAYEPGFEACQTVQVIAGGDSVHFEIIATDGELLAVVGVGEDGRLWIEGSTCEAKPPRRDGIPDTALVAGCGLEAGHPPPHVVEWPEQRAVDGSGQEAGTISWVGPGVEVREDPRLPRDAWFVVVPAADDERRDSAADVDEYTRQFDELLRRWPQFRERWTKYVEDAGISRVPREFAEALEREREAMDPVADARRERIRQDAAALREEAEQAWAGHPAGRWAMGVHEKMERLAADDERQRELREYAAACAERARKLRDGPYAEMYGGAPPWPGPCRWVECPECGSTDEATDTPCTNLACPSHERRGSRREERAEAEMACVAPDCGCPPMGDYCPQSGGERGSLGAEASPMYAATRAAIERDDDEALRKLADRDPVDDALRVLAEYVTLPYGGRRLVEDAGAPERVRGDARNRQMMERVLAHGRDAGLAWPVQRPQRQDALAAQLRDVAIAATRMGCYDAADSIGRRLAG